MEETTWEQRLQAVTHILTNPTTKPSLHSQFFIGALIPSYISWDYPPIYSQKHLRQWWISQYLKRVSRFGLPDTSWRSNCPYYQPPPAVMAVGVEEGKWGIEERREYARKRLRRKRLVNETKPLRHTEALKSSSGKRQYDVTSGNGARKQMKMGHEKIKPIRKQVWKQRSSSSDSNGSSQEASSVKDKTKEKTNQPVACTVKPFNVKLV